MKHLLVLLVIGLAVCGCATQRQKGTAATPHADEVVIYMIGDSTMANKPVIPAYPERGWGQMLHMYFNPGIRIENLSANGRSSRSFRDEGRWQPVLDHAKPGDYVIIQFGHNDEKTNTVRFTEPFGTFKENLARYVNETRERKAYPVLATSVARRKFNADGKLVDTHGNYIVATRQVAKELNVPLLDLNRDSSALLKQMGPENSKRLFDWVEPGEFAKKPEGLKDDTHFNAFGASRMCDLAVEEMKTAVPDLAKWLKD